MLSVDQIRAVARGCLAANVEGGAVRFHRIHEPLGALYRRDESSRVRLECPACVRLDFVTDSLRLRIGLRYGAGARQIFLGAVRIAGGEPIAIGPSSAVATWEGEVLLGPSRAERRVEIWLPHMVRADVTFLELDDGAAMRPSPAAGLRWLAYGDSITQGMQAPLPTESWVARAASQVGADVLNYGIGGAKMDAALAESASPFPYDIASVAYGTNDFNAGVPVETYGANLRRFLEALGRQRPGTAVVVITVLTWAGRCEPNRIGRTLDDYRRAAVGAASGLAFCRVLDGASLVPDDPAFFVDGVHPNAKGMAAYGDAVARELKRRA